MPRPPRKPLSRAVLSLRHECSRYRAELTLLLQMAVTHELDQVSTPFDLLVIERVGALLRKKRATGGWA